MAAGSVTTVSSAIVAGSVVIAPLGIADHSAATGHSAVAGRTIVVEGSVGAARTDMAEAVTAEVGDDTSR